MSILWVRIYKKRYVKNVRKFHSEVSKRKAEESAELLRLEKRLVSTQVFKVRKFEIRRWDSIHSVFWTSTNEQREERRMWNLACRTGFQGSGLELPNRNIRILQKRWLQFHSIHSSRFESENHSPWEFNILLKTPTSWAQRDKTLQETVTFTRTKLRKSLIIIQIQEALWRN